MRGRQLSAYGSNTYKYDANGIRLEKKTASGVTHKYWTEGERIHHEYRSNGETLWYYYDTSGIEGFSHSGVRYHYLKNLQGDIVGITNSAGNLVAQYFYDAWGNHKVCDVNGYENTSTGFIGNVNPFRYRGYYFDRETGLYYLQSRYYDPEFGRFINADDVSVLTSENAETLGALNLYAYCNNNPVMLSDPTGYVGKLALVLAIISAVFAAGAAVLSFAALMNAIGNYKREKTATNIFAVVTAAISFGISLIELAVSIVSVVQAVKAIHFAKLAEKSAKVAAQPAVAKNASIVSEQDQNAIISAAQGLDPGDVKVYTSTSDKYVGITNNVKRRSAQHLRKCGREIQGLKLKPLSRKHARFVEQAFIDRAGLANIANKINSISKTSKLYNEYLVFWNSIVW